VVCRIRPRPPLAYWLASWPGVATATSAHVAGGGGATPFASLSRLLLPSNPPRRLPTLAVPRGQRRSGALNSLRPSPMRKRTHAHQTRLIDHAHMARSRRLCVCTCTAYVGIGKVFL
jgi:hypothetical protein